MNTTARSVSKWCAVFLCTSLALSACKKEESQNLAMQGTITDGRNGEPLSGVSAVVSHQKISNGVFSLNFVEAARSITDGSGNYSMSWDRANSNSIKLTGSLENYITRSAFVNPSSITPGSVYTQNLVMFPEAFIRVRLVNELPSAEADNINFRFKDVSFDCACCDINPKSFTGATVDTAFTCKLYGDTWLKYMRIVATNEADTTITDSIFVPAFQTSQIDIFY